MFGIGSTFNGGFFEGAVVVVDLMQPAVVCHAPIKVYSSVEIDARDDLQKAVEKDFKKNLDKALGESMGTITEVYSGDVYGI